MKGRRIQQSKSNRGAQWEKRTEQNGRRAQFHEQLRCTNALHVSIHAPVWGATKGTLLLAQMQAFQSTRPCGARPAAPAASGTGSGVSIHAPVWGATI
jgi:hypothetical protein